jgi:hypothetical protein
MTKRWGMDDHMQRNISRPAAITLGWLVLGVIGSGNAVLGDGIPPVFSASVGSGSSSTGPSTVSASFSNTVPISNGGIAGTLTGNEFAGAGPGGVRGSSSMALSQPGVPGLSGGVGAFAQSSSSATFSDFVITGPGGATTVAGSLKLTLDGTSETSSLIMDGLDNTQIQAFTQIDLGVSGGVAGLTYAGTFTQVSGADGKGPTSQDSSATGVFTGDSVPTGFTSAVTSLPVGTFFTVSLQLTTDAGAGYSASATILGNDTTDVELQAINDFSSTFTFPTSGPVFNLPAGYTVNSVSADIVNNQYLGGAPASVPEPGTSVLLGSGVLLAAFLRRR